MWFSLSQTGHACTASERPPNGEMREVHLYSISLAVKTCCCIAYNSKMDSSKQFLCDECGESFTNNQNQLRHVRTGHQGKKRTDNETRKSEVTANEAGKQGILACGSWAACEAAVESNPHAVFKPPAEYVAVAMKANECKLGHRDIY